jgi:hypothetical protein
MVLMERALYPAPSELRGLISAAKRILPTRCDSCISLLMLPKVVNPKERKELSMVSLNSNWLLNTHTHTLSYHKMDERIIMPSHGRRLQTPSATYPPLQT